MKAYTFINDYIRGIQVGVQAGHAIVELMDNWTGHKDVSEWIRNHKTFVWLNGGDSDTMQGIINTIAKADVAYEFFLEPGLGNITTAIAVVPPVEIVNAVEATRLDEEFDGDFTDDQIDLIELLAGSRSKQL